MFEVILRIGIKRGEEVASSGIWESKLDALRP